MDPDGRQAGCGTMVQGGATSHCSSFGGDIPSGGSGGGDSTRAGRAPILGNAQNSVNTPTHASTSQRLAELAASRPDSQSVNLNRSLRTITGDPNAPNIRPDVCVSRTCGSIDMIEVRSSGQTRAELIAKLAEARASLGVPGRDIVVDPDARSPTSRTGAPSGLGTAGSALGVIGIFHIIFHEYVNHVEASSGSPSVQGGMSFDECVAAGICA